MTTAPPLPSTIAGRYRPRALLGSGGMATVWEAVDDRLDRPVAVKVVATTDPSAIERCRAEARVLATLRHPNVVTVLDAGEHDGRPFVVTELVRGRSLRDRLAEGPLPPAEAGRLGRQLAAALACAHRHGIVHRDLTPANVLLADGSGDAKVIDFGIAVSDHAVGLTATGLVIGTPAYLAPEQVEGRRAGPAVDVYALGLVLIEALTGERPFPGGPTATAAARLVGDAPVPDDLPAGWTPLLAAMTRRDPDARPDADAVEHRMAVLERPSDPPTGWSAGAATVTAAVAASGSDPAHLDSITTALPVSGAVAAGATGATGATTALPATEVRPTPPPSPRRKGRRATWPLVLAGTALVLALVVVVAFGALQGRDEGPDVATTPSSAPAADGAPAVDTTVAATTVTVAATVAPTTVADAAPTGPGAGATKPDPGKDPGTGKDAGPGKGKGKG